jgi:hypothetical protein
MKETLAQFLKVKDFPFTIKDKNGKQIYFEDSNGFWSKTEYNSDGNEIYYEHSNGFIIDKRPKPVVEMTLQEVASKLGMDVKSIRIKD